MKKILVTTDFSANSKAALRFAIQLASQYKYELTFFHSFHIMKPTSWNDTFFKSFEKSESIKIQNRLLRFVGSVYKGMGIVPSNFACVIKSSFLTDINIMEYAAQNKFSFIAIGKRGDGQHSKIFGTNTSNLINHSDVPVIAVPNTYRRNKISKILYASDLINLKNEVEKVVDFAKPLKANVELLHFKVPSDVSEDSKIIENNIKKISNYSIKLHLEKFEFSHTLISNLEKEIKKSAPSMMIMFTQQNRSFFEKIFLSSISSEYSFKAKIPLLIFKKG